jgi:hypothetical protein
MKIIRNALLGIVALAVIGGCATLGITSPKEDTEAKRFTPPAGKCNIYIIRDSSMVGNPVAFNVALDRLAVGTIGPGVYYWLVVSPGSHTILVSSSENNQKVKIETQEGRNYYVEVRARIGMAIRVECRQLEEKAGKELVLGTRFAGEFSDDE